MKKSVIIIGSGYGGMALANIMGKAGYRVDVYEKNTELGGRIASIKKEGYTFDIGPSWYLMPEVFEQYYQLFGASANERLDLLRLSPGYKVYFENHKPIIIQGDVKSDRETFESVEPGAGEKLQAYVARSTKVYNIAIKHFLYSNFKRIRDLLKAEVFTGGLSMLALVTKPLDRYVSSIFKDQRLKQILEYHMVFLGSSPFQAPAIYTLMSHLDFKSGVYYPRRGMMSLVDDLHELGQQYDITYHTDSPVQQIIIEDNVAVGVKLGDDSEARADIVVSNADLEFTETKLLDANYQSYPASYWQRRQPGPGALLVSLGVRGELPQLLHHNLYFVENWRQNFADIYENKKVPEHASLYVCNPTKTDSSYAPDGHENLFIMMPLPAGINLTEDEQATLANRAIRQFGEAIGEDLSGRITTRHISGPQNF